jgi:hypothetical protein
MKITSGVEISHKKTQQSLIKEAFVASMNAVQLPVLESIKINILELEGAPPKRTCYIKKGRSRTVKSQEELQNYFLSLTL